MQMDTIRWEYSLRQIAPGYLLHIRLRRKIKLLSIDIYREIGMVMHDKRSWCEYISCKYADNNEQDEEKVFSHRV
jgi:hypothetical protein